MFGVFKWIQNYFAPSTRPEVTQAQSEILKLSEIVNELKRENGEFDNSGQRSKSAELMLQEIEPDLIAARDAFSQGKHAQALQHARHGIIKSTDY